MSEVLGCKVEVLDLVGVHDTAGGALELKGTIVSYRVILVHVFVDCLLTEFYQFVIE